MAAPPGTFRRHNNWLSRLSQKGIRSTQPPLRASPICFSDTLDGAGRAGTLHRHAPSGRRAEPRAESAESWGRGLGE
jgi:hypothetical protein